MTPRADRRCRTGQRGGSRTERPGSLRAPRRQHWPAGTYDVIFTFDVVHEAVDPRGLLRAIRTALNPGGTYVCLDINCSAHLHENTGPLGSLFLGCSTLYCMTTSLAGDGEALGTIGLHPAKLDELATGAGFWTVHRVDLDNLFNNLYELRG